MQLFLLIALALFGLAVRLMYINDTKGHNYTIQVLAQQSYQSRSLPYQRGSITDRNGIVLAASEKVYNMILDAKIMNSDDGKYLNTTLNLVSVNSPFIFVIFCSVYENFISVIASQTYP